MKRMLLLAMSVAILPVAAAQSATPVPCEKMLADVRTAIAGAHLSAANKATVVDLENKGIERCKADDDAHADEFFAAALKAMGR